MTLQHENETRSKNSSDDGDTRESLLITIFSMVFTIISILLSVFEYTLSSKFLKQGSIMITKFEFESQHIADMIGTTFRDNVVFSHYYKLIHLISKTVHVNAEQVERMIPIQSNNGVRYTFIIDCHYVHFDHIWDSFYQSICSNTLTKHLQTKIYNIKDQCKIDENKISHLRLSGSQNDMSNNNSIVSSLPDQDHELESVMSTSSQFSSITKQQQTVNMITRQNSNNDYSINNFSNYTKSNTIASEKNINTNDVNSDMMYQLMIDDNDTELVEMTHH